MSRCKVCGARATRILTMQNDHGEPRALEIFQCTTCALTFVGNTPTEREIENAYRTLDQGRYYHEIGAPDARRITQVVKDILGILDADAQAVLDVGCGRGHFLEALSLARPGIRAMGHELDGRCVAACAEKGLNVFAGSLDQFCERFSVVTLLDVAEHVSDPLRTFRTCHLLCRPGGYLYIHTPRRCLWDRLFFAVQQIPGWRKLARTWLRTRISIFHLQLWTDQALRLTLERAGFEVIYLKSEMELSWPLERYVRVYVQDKAGVGPGLAKLVTFLAKILFVRLGTLRNKAICLARRR